MKQKIGFYIVFLGALLFLLSACSASQDDAADKKDKQEDSHLFHADNGDLRELTASQHQLPQFLQEKPEQMQLVYKAAAQHQKLLESIPCYCGCGESAAHKDNYDCFVFENKRNGEVVWDDHGTRCGVCLDIAAESIIKYKEGQTPEEIRNFIDDKYKEGYAAPTPTPFPG